MVTIIYQFFSFLLMKFKVIYFSSFFLPFDFAYSFFWYIKIHLLLKGNVWLWFSGTQSLSRVWLFVTAWTEALQAPLSMEFPKQEYWSKLPFAPPGDLLDPETERTSPALAGRFFTAEPPGKPIIFRWWLLISAFYLFLQKLFFTIL